MAIFAVGSAGCALASTTTELVLWRLVQAVGACVGPMLARAIVRDMYQGVRAAQVLSTLVLIMAIAPIAGPLLGGFLVVSGGWRLIFGLLQLSAPLFCSWSFSCPRVCLRISVKAVRYLRRLEVIRFCCAAALLCGTCCACVSFTLAIYAFYHGIVECVYYAVRG